MDEFEHILPLLKQVKKAIEHNDSRGIKKISEEIIQHTMIHQDADLVAVSVIVYALGKIIEREDYKKGKSWSAFYRRFCKNIDDMIIALQKHDVALFRDEVAANRALIDTLSSDLKHYISDVFIKSKINKASRLYDQGISLEKTANTLGISLWDLSEYTGQRKINEIHLTNTLPIKERVRFAEGIFE